MLITAYLSHINLVDTLQKHTNNVSFDKTFLVLVIFYTSEFFLALV